MATTDPYRYLSNAGPRIRELAVVIYTITRALAGNIWIGRGWSPDSTEHATGRALDIIVASKVGLRPSTVQKLAGDLVAAWLVRHAKTLHLRHIIWNRRIYRTRYGTWGPLPGRTSSSSISDWHEDHLHIWLDDNNGTVPTAARAPLVIPTAPTSGRPRVSLSGLRNAALTDPAKRSQDDTTNWAATILVERALEDEGLLGGSLVDGHYGTATIAAYAAWQRRLGYTGADADGIPGRASLVKLGARHGFDVIA